MKFQAEKRAAICTVKDKLTTGSVGLAVQFVFSQEWDGLVKVAVFRAGNISVDVALTGESCTVPPEVLTMPGEVLSIGVYGTDSEGTVVIPTVYAEAGRIVRGAEPSGVEPTSRTQPLIDQLLTAAQAARDAAEEAERLAMSDAVKQALLQFARKAAYVDDQGQSCYSALHHALYPPAVLVSIEAAFNQGSAVVYDTASLEDLKTYLTVTASYEDGTRETVTGYTLSGTLTEGTSTITVHYSGQTSTFTVLVTHATADTSPVITDYDKRIVASGVSRGKSLVDNTGCCVTDHYDWMGQSGSKVVVFAPYTEDTSPYTQAQMFVYESSGECLEYFNVTSGNTNPKTSSAVNHDDIATIRFNLYTSGLDRAYAYDQTSGSIYFAGANSLYYGLSNISEANE